MDPWLALQLASTLALCGLIWTVQLVHYPLLVRSGVAGSAGLFAQLHAAHVRAIGWLVAPLMPLEALGAGATALAPPEGVPRAAALLGLALVGLCWLSTALVQAPLHGRLSAGFDRTLGRRLVATNWVRTAAWSARGALVLWMAQEAAR